MNLVLPIALGGAIGAVARHYVGVWVLMMWGSAFPWGTLSVNIIGSAAMGVLVGIFSQSDAISPALRAFLTVGVLGGFTTFSAFSLDAVNLYERGEIFMALGYIVASVLISVAALAAGLYGTRMILS